MPSPSTTQDASLAVSALHLSIAHASGNSLLVRLIRDLRQRTRMFGLRRRIPGEAILMALAGPTR
jgi:DNA-binding GntR family transcriptional regulator